MCTRQYCGDETTRHTRWQRLRDQRLLEFPNFSLTKMLPVKYHLSFVSSAECYLNCTRPTFQIQFLKTYFSPKDEDIAESCFSYTVAKV
ncbi:hypothetical protein AVEN_5210-1 [Araneus ventricosus]|uniref:Uncharacterized protein n=1 Tax=Araneus ventricosus TaxID=182803 RepID=A0A4Y2G2J6_ARAVE|nr:hypothetical protein AVEN_5210-1 [Araneus ventricosus]